MPYIHVQVTRENISAEQKAAIIHGATNLMVEVLAKDPATTFVIIEEVELENWGVGGLPVAEYRALRTVANRSEPGRWTQSLSRC